MCHTTDEIIIDRIALSLSTSAYLSSNCYLLFDIFVEPAIAVRSSQADARGSIQLGYDTDGSGSEKQDRDTEKPVVAARRQSVDIDNNGISLRSITYSKEKDLTDGDMTNQFKSEVATDHATSTPVRKKSFVALPNTTTWQQQSVNYQHADNNSKYSHYFWLRFNG